MGGRLNMEPDVERLYDKDEASVCFFRTTVKEPYKKCLIQITEWKSKTIIFRTN